MAWQLIGARQLADQPPAKGGFEMTRSVFRAVSMLLGVVASAACAEDFDAELDAVGTDEAGLSFATEDELERHAAREGVEIVWSPPPAEPCADKKGDSKVGGSGSFAIIGGDVQDCKWNDPACMFDMITWCAEDGGVIHCFPEDGTCTCVTGTC
jgi:hypothetical protein